MANDQIPPPNRPEGSPPAPGLDPWKHRAANMRCASCMWFAPKDPSTVGRCRRHAPTMNGYPAVFQSDWCGDHKLDETKIKPEPKT